MFKEKTVSDHYTHGSLLDSIQASITRLGKTIGSVTVEDLGPVDEFHIGGREATEHFLNQLNFSGQDHILDVGCGLGGASRFIASRYKAKVSGIDLTQEYIDTGNTLCRWVGLNNQVTLLQGNALSIPFDDEYFDGALMLHVAMNIEDKAQLFAEVYRVLRPGSTLGVYDIMRNKDGELAYPVPWATEKSTSLLATADQYKQAMSSAGFVVSKENDRRDFALDFFKKLRVKNEANGGPPPLGLHTLMGESTTVKIKNMIDNIDADLIAPVEIIAYKK